MKSPVRSLPSTGEYNYGEITESSMKSILPIAVVVFLVTTIVIPVSRPRVAASPKATVNTLKQLEGKFMKAAADKGSRGYMSYYAEDAVEVPNGAALISGKVNIAKGMGFLDDPTNRLTWTPVAGDISSSGDLGYTFGNYEFRSKDKNGTPHVQYGKYTSIWRLQKDGSWKVALDMGNASPSPQS